MKLYNLSYLLFPKRCGVCNDVINIHNDYCINCERKLHRVPDYHQKIFAVNNKYITKIAKPYFDVLSAPFYHTGGSRRLIYNYKFRNRSELKYLLSKEMFIVYKNYFKDYNIDCIVAVPSKFLNNVKRGYNQVALLAKQLSKLTGLPYIKAIKQVGKKQVQHSLRNINKRFENVKGIYFVNDEFIKGKNVLLIDDIVTSGATVNECARVLKKAGVNKVFVLSCTVFD